MSPTGLASLAASEQTGGRLASPCRINRPERMPGALPLKPRRMASTSPVALSSLSDGELVGLARDGNADAFQVLYERHASAAYSLAYRMCGVQGMAEDVVQEAFLSVWRRLDRYDVERGPLRSWLLGIVHNGAIDRLRQSGAHDRRRASGAGIEERLEAPQRTDFEVQQREDANQVRSALRQLPSEQRRVIELAYFDGLTHTQIASMLELPVGTVKGRMRLGLTKLRTLLAPAMDTSESTGRAVV